MLSVRPLGYWLMWRANVGGMAAVYVRLQIREFVPNVLLCIGCDLWCSVRPLYIRVRPRKLYAGSPNGPAPAIS